MSTVLEKPLADAAKRNILTVAQIEQELLRRHSPADRLGASVAWLFGSIPFIVLHTAGCGVWIALNSGTIPGVPPFDPYPFCLLALVIGLESIGLATFVLMNQNQQLRRADQWAHLSLQVGLLAEQEITKVLQMQQALGKRFGLEQAGSDHEMKELTRTTEVAALVEEIGKTRDVSEPLVETGHGRNVEEKVALGFDNGDGAGETLANAKRARL